MVYFAKGWSWLTTGQVVSSVSTFVLAIAFANLIPKETYGTYQFVLSILGILTISSLRGMDGAITQAVARGYEGVLIPAIKSKLTWGVIGSMAGVFVSAYYFLNGNLTLATIFLISSIFVPVLNSFGIYNSFFEGKKLFKETVIYGMTSQIIATIVMISTVFLTNNILIILSVYLTTWTLLRFFLFIRTIKKFSPNKNHDPEIISYGKHSSVVNITATLIGSLDSIILFHYLGAAELAVYSFALAPVLQLRGLFGNIPTLAIPKFASRPIGEINKMLWKRMGLLFVIGIAVATAYTFIAPIIFSIFFPQYLDSVILSQVFSFSIALTLGQSIFGAALGSKLTMIPKKYLYLWNIPSIVLTASIFILIQYFGAMGVIASRMLSLITITAVTYIIWRKISKIEELQITSS